MDWIAYTGKGMSILKKHRYTLFAILAGILLLTLPGQKPTTQEDSVPRNEPEPTLEIHLAKILSLIEGAGRVEVLLTNARGEETVYQTDEDLSSGEHTADQQRDTVLITGEGRLETGLIKQINPPVYRGAVIVCQGAGNPQVRLSVVEAVMSVTGLTSDKITVLKMK